MKIRQDWKTWLAGIAAGLVIASYPYVDAFAMVGNDASFYPPNGWPELCSTSSINVTPGVNARSYAAQGTCWINVGDLSDSDKQSWTQVPVSMAGSYAINSNTFIEKLTVNAPSGAQLVMSSGTCNDDPWATNQTCAMKQYSDVSNFSWRYGLPKQTGPLSTLVFGTNLIQSKLNKQESQPPVAPVALDPVRWPTNGGKSQMGMIKWRAGDMSGNKWVLQFDIEYANYADSTFTKAGQRVGLGPKQNFSASDANMVYVFSTPFALQTTADYFFRVCAVNDAGRQCSAPVKARQPTKLELESVAGQSAIKSVTLANSPTNPPAAPPAAREAPRALALTGKTGGTTGTGGAGAGSTGSGGTTPAGSPPTAVQAPRVFGAALLAKPGGATGTGGSGTGGSGTGGSGTGGSGTGGSGTGGATPGAAGAGSTKPDLSLAPEGMLINDQNMAWNGTNRLELHTDATHTCQVHVSFRYTNLGKVAAKNVIAEIRDSLHPAQTIATSSVPVLAQGQFSTVSGVAKINASSSTQKIIFTAIVHEKGKPEDSNVSNNRGAITMGVFCAK